MILSAVMLLSTQEDQEDQEDQFLPATLFMTLEPTPHLSFSYSWESALIAGVSVLNADALVLSRGVQWARWEEVAAQINKDKQRFSKDSFTKAIPFLPLNLHIT